MRKVATFWKELTKCLLRYAPTSGLAKAFTRSAWALFQVNFGSSKYPETWRTKTSFSSFFALSAASEGEPDHTTEVPYDCLPHFLQVGESSLPAGALAKAGAT